MMQAENIFSNGIANATKENYFYRLVSLARKFTSLYQNVNRQIDAASAKQRYINLDLSYAQEIQTAIVSRSVPVVKGWDISCHYSPYSSVSGDVYDFYCDSDNLEGVSLFDVSGHGVAAGLVAFIVRTLMSQYFHMLSVHPLNQIIETFNSALSKEINGTNLFASGVVLKMAGDHIEYVNAGHPDILIKRNGGSVQRISCSTGTYLGLNYFVGNYPVEKVQVSRNDCVLLFTDGFLDCDNGRNRYELERIIQSFSKAPDSTAEDILNCLLSDLGAFMRNNSSPDDISIIVMKKTG